ncbi:MAG: protoporphyrinogen oxidase [Desulfovibrio sp.]|nr:protoporphyrinogen oxidase [Desulfovibrio sp.]
MIRFCSFLLVLALLALTNQAIAKERVFSEFSLDLPQDWDGSERTGISSRDQNEYMLFLGKKDAEEENYVAYLSIYLLPNKPGKDAEQSARALASQQAEASEPVEEGPFWVFTGNPRDTILKGQAKTLVTANKDDLLIIIVKDPASQGAEGILKSLKATDERSARLLKQSLPGQP